ncbi:MAG: hypothetical protein HKP09_09890 [Enterobacterales bacterium]|nr:hypothetical protein [Enterobacterales bacterium]
MADYESSVRVSVVAHSLYLANLLFTGVTLIILLVVYKHYYSKVPALMQAHLRQATAGAIITSLIFLILNSIIYTFVGYFSVSGLVVLEVYYMFIVPLCVIPGIIGLTKALKGQSYYYPLIGRLVS